MDAAKHGAAAGDAARPGRADWTVDQGWESYTPEEHGVWRTLAERQGGLLPGRACDEFLQGLRLLDLGSGGIPDFRRLSEVLTRRTGWQVVAVPGLVPDEVFFDHLAHRRFPAGRFIRRPEELDYLEEPDVFHDVYGHVPMLMHPAFADYMQAYGAGGLRARRLGALENLARVYWYTVEFGLVEGPEGLRLYGAGIASSRAETIFALTDDSPHRLRFALERVLRTRYRIDDFQETYFVIPGFDALLELARIDFAPLYERVLALPTIEPGEILPEDIFVARGTGAYHAARRPAG
ncbi:phenylalanine 4-monooxygenase [Roseomonas sp. OT10]|uniref:phenylalanine 4-monooxygenase n=1 Tax=Roseomonas cutis TaxID=2897332 RepID=UPI001E3B39A2|nr:phenylalanine 4-monooxygenase [Roseomonas sp. OT10]UFN50343.1 phenylalanine 4-monooxygenase [Roseomonas sp. OT10]